MPYSNLVITGKVSTFNSVIDAPKPNFRAEACGAHGDTTGGSTHPFELAYRRNHALHPLADANGGVEVEARAHDIN